MKPYFDQTPLSTASDRFVSRFGQNNVTPIFSPWKSIFLASHREQSNDPYQSTSRSQDVLPPPCPKALHLVPYLCPLFTYREHQLLGTARGESLSRNNSHLKKI